MKHFTSTTLSYLLVHFLSQNQSVLMQDFPSIKYYLGVCICRRRGRKKSELAVCRTPFYTFSPPISFSFLEIVRHSSFSNFPAFNKIRGEEEEKSSNAEGKNNSSRSILDWNFFCVFSSRAIWAVSPSIHLMPCVYNKSAGKKKTGARKCYWLRAEGK